MDSSLKCEIQRDWRSSRAVENVGRASSTGGNKEDPKWKECDDQVVLECLEKSALFMHMFLVQAAKEPAQTVSMKSFKVASDVAGKGSERPSEKTESSLSRICNTLKNKVGLMSSQPDSSSKKQAASSRSPRESPASQRFSIIDKPEEQAAEKISQLEVVSKVYSVRTVSSSRNVSVNDDTLSDGSDCDARSQPKEKLQKQPIDDMEISEELDEITYTSEVDTDEDNSFKMKLDNVVSQQNKHPILKPKDHQVCADKVTKLKEEKAQLKNQLEEAKDDQCVMEHKLMQMESDISNLRLSKEEQERLKEELRQTRAQLSQQRCIFAQLQQKLKNQDCTMEHLRTELENSSTKQRDLLKENKALKEQIEDLHQDLRLTNDKQATTVLEFNNEVMELKYKLKQANDQLDAQCQANSVLEAETQALRSRLADAEHLRREAEKVLLQEKEEQQQFKDKVAGEMAIQQEEFSKLSQKLSKAKEYGISLEDKLTEKNTQNADQQRELDQLNVRVKELEALLQSEKELVTWASVRQEATQELLSKAENKGIVLQKNLEESQKLFSDIVSMFRSNCEDKVQFMQDRNQDLAARADELQEHIHQLQEERNQSEATLADLLKKQSKCEAALEVHKQYVAAAKLSIKQLEDVVQRQRSLLQGARRKLRDHQASEIETEKVDELQAELRRQMNFRSLLEKSMQQLENEVQSLRRRLETKSEHVEQYRLEIEEKARQEIQKKIHEVNLFLQSQAAMQEAQDQIKASTEANLRSKIQELQGKLKRARSAQHETNAQKDALNEALKRYQLMRQEGQL
ncbi:ankyrin repeat domain-containing protein 26-like isoform X3 [Festucalex cinctus]